MRPAAANFISVAFVPSASPRRSNRSLSAPALLLPFAFSLAVASPVSNACAVCLFVFFLLKVSFRILCAIVRKGLSDSVVSPKRGRSLHSADSSKLNYSL